MAATGLDPAETGKVTGTLDEKGIGYEVRNNGTAIAVEKAQMAQARIALAEKGLPGTGDQPGFELFDKQKLGASDFQQQVTYQRALEGQIARTVKQVDGVDGVSVRLVLPEDQLFEESQTPATAAVLLEGPANGLEPGSVRGIAQLVASSVKGLKTSNVSITDGSGTLLWPRSGDGADGGTLSKQAAQARYEQQLEGSLTALLNRTVGPGKAEVQATVDLNADQATKDELTYARDGVPLKSKVESERLRGTGAAGARSGTGANIPRYAAGGAAGGDSNYNRRSDETDFGVDKTVTRTKVAPGAVNRLDVALLIDRSVPAGDAAQIRNAVSSAAGIQRVRGDTLTVSQVAFPKAVAPASPSPKGAVMDYAGYVLAGIALLAFLVVAARQLRRREDETLMREPRWLREIEAPTTLADLEGPRPASALPERVEHPARRQVEELAEREPERVAQQIRSWMRDS
jgi:flagellar M-ring protein FliF